MLLNPPQNVSNCFIFLNESFEKMRERLTTSSKSNQSCNAGYVDNPAPIPRREQILLHHLCSSIFTAKENPACIYTHSFVKSRNRGEMNGLTDIRSLRLINFGGYSGIIDESFANKNVSNSFVKGNDET